MSLENGIGALDRFAVMFADLAELGQELRAYQSLEGMAKGLEGRAAEAKGQLAEMGPKIEQAKQQAADIVSGAVEEAGEKVAQANNDAQSILAKAQSMADSIVSKAVEQKDSAISAAAIAKAEAESWAAKRDEAKAAHDELAGNIANLRKDAARILG